MSVIRYEPFRDPFERLISMAATGTRAPLAMPMDVYRSAPNSLAYCKCRPRSLTAPCA